MDAPHLFGPFFNHPAWRAWKAFIGGLYGLPLGPNLRAIHAKHTRRPSVPTQAAREGWIVVGRRGGKSRIAAFLATYTACLRDFHEYLAPGELARIPVVAADMDQAGAIFGYILGFVDAIPALRALRRGRPSGGRIEFTTGVEIIVKAATFRGLRGKPTPLVICDEIAFWRNEESRNPDVEILRALRPGMLTIPGAMLIGLSSPYARRGELWETYKKHYGKETPRTFVWQAETRDMNPTADEAEIVLAYDEDPIAASAEYGGQFRSDLEAYVPQEVVELAMAGQPSERPPQSGISYSAFLDPSGGSSDSFTLAIGHPAGNRGVLDLWREERAPYQPTEVVAKFADILHAYGCTTVKGDHYAGEWPREAFGKHGISYVIADQNKSELYLAFLPALMSERVDLLQAPRILNQLCALDRRTSRMGKDSVDHPPGGHDDVANAVAGCLAPLVGGVNDGLGFLHYLERQGAKREEAAAAAAEVVPIPSGSVPISLGSPPGWPTVRRPAPLTAEERLAGYEKLESMQRRRRGRG